MAAIKAPSFCMYLCVACMHKGAEPSITLFVTAVLSSSGNTDASNQNLAEWQLTLLIKLSSILSSKNISL